MPPKKSEASHFEKVFFLFELFFLREPREWTIKELSERFQARGISCAPNTIRNLIEDLRRAMGDGVIEEVKKGKVFYYRPMVRFQRKQPGDISSLSLVDYTRHSSKLETLMKALNQRLICNVWYQSLAGSEKEHQILPLKAISHHDVIYVYAWHYPSQREIENLKEKIIEGKAAPGFPFLLAFHRVKSLSILKKDGQKIKIKNYAKEQEEFLKKLRERCFGLIKKDKFKVRIRFEKSVELYLKERTWSEDESYPTENELVFSATSRPEVKSWVLSFGKNLSLLEPYDLRQEILEELKAMLSIYDSTAKTEFYQVKSQAKYRAHLG